MRRRYARRECKAGRGQVWDIGVKRIGEIDRDIGIAAAGRQSEIACAASVIRAAPPGERENSAVIGLALIFKRKCFILVWAAVLCRLPPPEIYAARNAADGNHVNRSLRIHAVSRLNALDDKGQRAETCRRRRQLWQAQILVGAETLGSRAD